VRQYGSGRAIKAHVKIDIILILLKITRKFDESMTTHDA